MHNRGRGKKEREREHNREQGLRGAGALELEKRRFVNGGRV